MLVLLFIIYSQGGRAMQKLKYKFTNDLLFKAVFVKLPGLLKMLVAAALGIPVKSISKFQITNAEIAKKWTSRTNLS